MIKTFCDYCNKEIKGSSYIYAYNACFNPICEAQVTLIAYKQSKGSTLKNVPNEKQVKEAKERLNGKDDNHEEHLRLYLRDG